MRRQRTKSEKLQRRQSDAVKSAAYKKHFTENPDVPNRCVACGEEKPLKEFLSSFTSRNMCKKCAAETVKRWRKNHPESYRSIGEKISKRASEHISKMKDVPCSMCGKKWPPYVMDFHHKDMSSKKATVSKMTGSSIDRLNHEMGKCELTCANCHRNETFVNRHDVPVLKNRMPRSEVCDVPVRPGDKTKHCGRCDETKNIVNFTMLRTGIPHTYCKSCLRKSNREYCAKRTSKSGKSHIISCKDNKPCTDCGQIFRYWMFDFDHVRGDKTCNVGSLQNMALQRIKDEIEKCDLVCVNCHRIRTHSRRHGSLNTHTVHVNFQKIRLVTLNKLDTAKKLLDECHYAGYGRAATSVYAAMQGDEIAAVAKFAPVVRKEVASKEGFSHDAVLELDRFYIVPKFQVKNMASKVMSLVVTAVKKEHPNVKLLVSFADPAQGHDGTIYKASNWKFVGTCAKSYIYERPDGVQINKKTLYDTAKRSGMGEKEYAASLMLSKIETPGKHKFVYRF